MVCLDNQENEERRNSSSKIRKAFHALDKSITGQRDKYIDCTDEDCIVEKFKDLDSSVDKIKHAPEQALANAVAFKMHGIAGDRVTKTCRKNGHVEAPEYRRILLARYGVANVDGDDGDAVAPEDFNWKQFGHAAASTVFRTAACCRMDCMLGALEPPRVRPTVKRVPRVKDVLAQQAKPDEMLAQKQDASNETSKLTEDMYNRLRVAGSQPWVLLVLNPDAEGGFAQTVENMFSVSMLVSNSKAALRVCPEWGLRVEDLKVAKDAARGGAVRDGPSQVGQMVMNFNFAVWEAIRARVTPDLCLTPHRAAIALHGKASSSRPAPQSQSKQPAAKKARKS